MHNDASQDWPPLLKLAYTQQFLRSRRTLSQDEFLRQGRDWAAEQHAVVAQRVTLLKASLRYAEDEESGLCSALNFYRNSITPRCQPLPREVLTRIFQIRYNDDCDEEALEEETPGYFASPAQVRSAIVFTGVCRLWREVARSYAYLWQVLPGLNRRKFLSRFVANSGRAPLMCCLAAGTSKNAAVHFQYWRQITGVRNRISYLSIDNTGEEGFIWHFKHSKTGGWDLLHTLVLRFKGSPDYDALSQMFVDSSQLRTLQIAFDGIESPPPPPCLYPVDLSSSSWLGVPWRNIVTFVGVKISEAFLYSILLSIPGLENCDVLMDSKGRTLPEPLTTAPTPLHHSNLRALKITNTPEGLFTRVLSHFTLPELSQFTCSLATDWSDDSLDDLPSCMRHGLPSLANITCLRLDTTELYGGLLISVLEGFDLLFELTLIAPYVDSSFFDTLRNRSILPCLRRLSLMDLPLSAFESGPEGRQLSVSLSQFIASRHGFIPPSDVRIGHSRMAQLEYLRLTVESIYEKLLPPVISTFSLLYGVESAELSGCAQLLFELEQILGVGGSNGEPHAEPKKEDYDNLFEVMEIIGPVIPAVFLLSLPPTELGALLCALELYEQRAQEKFNMKIRDPPFSKVWRGDIRTLLSTPGWRHSLEKFQSLREFSNGEVGVTTSHHHILEFVSNSDINLLSEHRKWAQPRYLQSFEYTALDMTIPGP